MKQISAVAWLSFTLVGALMSSSVWAHHSFQAEYDQSQPLTLVGTVTRVKLENPHGWIYLDTMTSEGKVVNWALELPSPNVVARNGFDRSVYQTLMMTGEQVTVTGYPARDGSKHAWAGGLTRADGKTVITLSGIPTRGRPGGPGGQ
jgi:hypothetical protein